MTSALYILADGARDLFGMVPIILIVVISIVVSILRKSAAQKAEQDRRSRAELEGRKQPARRAGYAQTGQTHPARQQPQPGRPQPGRTTGPAGPPPAPRQGPQGPGARHRPDLELARETLRSMGLIVEQPTQRAPQADQPVTLAPAEPQSIRVEEKLKLQRRRERKLDAERRKRLAPPKIPEADSATIEGRLLRVRPEDKAEQDVPTGVIVDLSRAESLRRAIIFHEIFSPPKALREGKEMWDV